VPAAAAPVCKHDESDRVGRQAEVSVERHAGHLEPNRARRDDVSWRAHERASIGVVSPISCNERAASVFS
jgi:hypothetical protein